MGDVGRAPTIREHLSANEQLLGFALNAADVAAPLTLEDAIKQARKHAVAALALLDEARVTTIERYELGPHYRLVLDAPAPSGDAVTVENTGYSHDQIQERFHD